MHDYDTEMARLETYLAGVDQKLAEFEGLQRSAGGHISESFAHRLEELRAQRQRLVEHIEQVKVADAESWSEEDFRAGLLEVWDGIGGRVAELIGHLRRHA